MTMWPFYTFITTALGLLAAGYFRLLHRLERAEQRVIVLERGATTTGVALEALGVNIQRVEVRSDDPDRFALGLAEAFREANGAPIDPDPVYFTTEPVRGQRKRFKGGR